MKLTPSSDYCVTQSGCALHDASHSNGNTEPQVSLFRPLGSVSSWNSGCGREYFTRPGQAYLLLFQWPLLSNSTPLLPGASCTSSVSIRSSPSALFIMWRSLSSLLSLFWKRPSDWSERLVLLFHRGACRVLSIVSSQSFTLTFTKQIISLKS